MEVVAQYSILFCSFLQACANGDYGQDCLLTCGNCAGGVACNHIDGMCPSGCEPGWVVGTCSEGIIIFHIWGLFKYECK